MRVFGLNQPALYFSFDKCEAQISRFISIYQYIILFLKKIVYTTKFHDSDSISVLNRPKYVVAARLKIVFSPTHFNWRHSNYS